MANMYLQAVKKKSHNQQYQLSHASSPTCMHSHACTHAHTPIQARTHAHAHTYKHARMHMHTHVHSCAYLQPPCVLLNAASTTFARHWPDAMQTVLTTVRAPRMLGGAHSPMYTGTVAEATPTPKPTTTRPSASIGQAFANARMAAPAMKTSDPTMMAGLRPKLADNQPAAMAPTKAPPTVRATINSFSKSDNEKSFSRSSSAVSRERGERREGEREEGREGGEVESVCVCVCLCVSVCVSVCVCVCVCSVKFSVCGMCFF